MRLNFVWNAALMAVLFGSLVMPVFAGEPTATERITALKATLAESQKVLRQYEWVETTVVTLKGEEVSRKQQRCYYGADGVIRKELMSQAAPQTDIRAGFGMSPVKQNEDMTEYIQAVNRLIGHYLPLNQDAIQAANEAHKLAFIVVEPGKFASLSITDFLKRGDRLALNMDLTDNRPLSLNLNSFLDSGNEPVTVAVTFGSLYGTATFAYETVMETMVKKLKVTIQNTGYHKTAP